MRPEAVVVSMHVPCSLFLQIARRCARVAPLCLPVLRPAIHVLLVGQRCCEQGNALAFCPRPTRVGTAQRAATECHGASPGRQSQEDRDDLHVITVPDHAREALDGTVRDVEENCGIASNFCKSRVFGLEGPSPPSIKELGQDVWRGDKPPLQRGAAVLGSPIDHAEYAQAWAEARLREEQQQLQGPHLHWKCWNYPRHPPLWNFPRHPQDFSVH